MDRFEDLRTFVAVAERGSVTGAARELERAASAVSRRITELEARLGAQLLTRTTRRVAPTAAGERLLARARSILADLDEAEADAREDRRGLSGTLRVAAPLTFGLAHLMPALNEFMAEHPALLVELDLDDRKVDLVAERLDVAVRLGETLDASLRRRTLASVQHVVAAAPIWWAAHGRPDAAEALEGAPALCYAHLDRPGAWAWERTDGTRGSVELVPRFVATSGDALVRAAIAGLGPVRLPTFVVNEAIETGALVPALLDHDWGRIGVHAVYPDTRYLPARTRALIDHLAARFAGEAPWDACLREARERALRAWAAADPASRPGRTGRPGRRALNRRETPSAARRGAA